MNKFQHELKLERVGPGAYEFECWIAVESFGLSHGLLRATEPGSENLLGKPCNLPRLA